MSNNEEQERRRSLAEIEVDLIKAENAFADADARFKKAQHDRREAINMIDKHQVEMDECFIELRQRSVPGSKWRQEFGEPAETLVLHSEDIVSGEARQASGDERLTSESTKKALGRDFDRLRESANSTAEDPVLKVVSGPRR